MGTVLFPFFFLRGQCNIAVCFYFALVNDLVEVLIESAKFVL